MVKPVLQAMVLADHVYQDKASGKHVIAGTFTSIQLHPPPKVEDIEEAGEKRKRVTGTVGGMGSPFLYLAFAGLRNRLPFKLQFIDLSDAKVLLELTFDLEQHDAVSTVEVVIPMPHLKVPPRNGSYSLDLLCDDDQIGSWRIEAVIIPEQNEGADRE